MTVPAPDAKLYRYHVANLRSLEIAIKNTALSARKAISKENDSAKDSFVRLYAFLIGAWAENRLKKLLFEQNGFSRDERNRVLSQLSQIDKWKKTVEVSFRKYYGIPRKKISENTLPFTAYIRFTTLNEIIDKDLRPIIEVRNRLAHGQWIYPLSDDGKGVEQHKYRLINNENLLSLQFKFKLVSNLCSIINDLVVSLPTFDRDFDMHYQHITNTRNNLRNRKYEKYVQRLVENRKQGIQRRKANKP
jgi:hypothetical protein